MSQKKQLVTIITLAEYGSLVCVIQNESNDAFVIGNAHQIMVESKSTHEMKPFKTLVTDDEEMVLIPFMGFLTDSEEQIIMKSNVIAQAPASQIIASEFIAMVEATKKEQGVIITQPQGIITQ